jgi:hypothetical protein
MKKGFLLIQIMFMFLLVSCQKSEAYEFLPDSNRLYFSYEYPEYALMFGQKNGHQVLLAMKEKDNSLVVYKIIQMPKIEGDVTIESMHYNGLEIPNVVLIIDGKKQYTKIIKRLSFMGYYYALELDYDDINRFEVIVGDGCFGQANPCHFNTVRNAFTEGPYINHNILSYYIEYVDKPAKHRSHSNNWFVIGEGKLAIFHLLTEYQKNLYRVIVQVEDNQLEYQSTYVTSNTIDSFYLYDENRMMYISDDLSYQFIDSNLLPTNGGHFSGDFIGRIQFYGYHAIETTTHYYIFEYNQLISTVIKNEGLSHVGAQFMNIEDPMFKYYYIEQNSIKFSSIDL